MNLKKSITKRLNKISALKLRYNFEREYKKIPHSFEFKKIKKPLVSVIIPVYNQFKYTKACLWSILKNTEGIDYEIIIADDNSTDETKNIVENIKGLVINRNKCNKGFLLNVNIASKTAKGKYIVLLNNDIVVRPNWLKYLLEAIEQNNDIGYVGAKCLNEYGVIQEAGCFVNSDATTGFLHVDESPYSKAANTFNEVDYCSACSVIIKKEIWCKLDGFDALFSPGYYEDVDLCFRIRHELGLKVVYQPQAEIYHFQGKTHGQKTNSLAKINRINFSKKWAKVLTRNID